MLVYYGNLNRNIHSSVINERRFPRRKKQKQTHLLTISSQQCQQ